MIEQPTGVVTFLFTDIEGSTRRWEEAPVAMREALARHHTLLRTAIETHAGYVFQIVGDAFCAAFAEAPAALAAAAAAQAALHAEPWGAVGPVLVRMAVYTGAAEAAAGDYRTTQALNRVSRLLSAGHGGQILLSRPTHELVRDALPACSHLLDLGEHRLRDLSAPEHIYQLVGEAWPACHTPIKTLDPRAHNLPVQLDALVGRQSEVAAVKALLLRPDVRLLTLSGPGGTGKTRLSLQVAADLIDSFEHGVWFVALDFLSDPEFVAPAIVQALGTREGDPGDSAGWLREYLRSRQLLLVLDNFEQVVGAAPLLTELLTTCPRLKIVVTTRTVLRLRGEHEYPVPPLDVPDLRRLPPLEALGQSPAIALFVQRATASNPRFALTADNAAAVVEICARLDGLPLAIELAAARTKLLAPAAMLARLKSRLKLLTGGGADLPTRQQTLRGALDWGHDLLSAAEQVLFRRLAVFAGGFTLEAAEAVANADGDLELDALDGVASLVDKSLLRPSAQDNVEHEPRFVMLETLREYALEKLADSGELPALRARHLAHYRALAEQAEPGLMSAEQGHWLDALEGEHDNFRAALEWSVAEGGEPAPGLQLAGALSRFWWVRGYLEEGRRWLDAALAQAPDASPASRAKALHAAGNLALPSGDYARAIALYEEALALRRTTGDKPGTAMLLNNLGFMAQEQGEPARARSLHEEALALRRELGDERGIALSLYNLGDLAKDHGDLALAARFHEEGLAVRRRLAEPVDVAASLHSLGDVLRCQGDYARASELLEESLALRQSLRDRMGTAASLIGLGEVARDLGEYARGEALLQQASAEWTELGNRLGAAACTYYLGDCARLRGDLARAIPQLEDSLAQFRALSNPAGIGLALVSLGSALAAQGEPARAAALLGESLTLRAKLDERRGIADSLEALGHLAHAQRDPERAARLLATAAALRAAAGAALPPAERDSHQRTVASVEAALGEERFATLWAAGQGRSLAEVLGDALQLVAS